MGIREAFGVVKARAADAWRRMRGRLTVSDERAAAEIRASLEAKRRAALSAYQREVEHERALWCAANEGRGFARPTRIPAAAWFWKRDAGALDGAGAMATPWRLYRRRLV